MSWRLFLDDCRFPPADGQAYVLARSMEEAVRLVEEKGMPSFISFDHDLEHEHYGGEGWENKSGFAFAKWLVECDMNGTHTFPEGFGFYVHSMNPVGAENIRYLLARYLIGKSQEDGLA